MSTTAEKSSAVLEPEDLKILKAIAASTASAPPRLEPSVECRLYDAGMIIFVKGNIELTPSAAWILSNVREIDCDTAALHLPTA